MLQVTVSHLGYNNLLGCERFSLAEMSRVQQLVLYGLFLGCRGLYLFRTISIHVCLYVYLDIDKL